MKKNPQNGLLFLLLIALGIVSCGQTQKAPPPICTIGATAMGSHNDDSGGSYCWGAGICSPNVTPDNSTVECTYCYYADTRLLTISFAYSEFIAKSSSYVSYFQDPSGAFKSSGTIAFDNAYNFYHSDNGNPPQLVPFFVPLNMPPDIKKIGGVLPYTTDANNTVTISVQY